MEVEAEAETEKMYARSQQGISNPRLACVARDAW